MPHFTLSLSPAGPLVDALVLPSAARQDALKAAGEVLPAPVTIRALIDTGASNTCIDPSVLGTLGLTPTGQVLCSTPSSGATPHQADQYDIALVIPAGTNQPPLVRATLPVMESHLLQSQGFHALIGRDVLEGCILTYNGATRLFMLAY